ncbi:hypothetical protein Bca4012_100955 [Brassica carinata]
MVVDFAPVVVLQASVVSSGVSLRLLMTSALVLGVVFESQASSQTVVVILCWQLSLQVGVVLLVARRCLCQAREIGLSSSSWLNQKWRFGEAGCLSFSLRIKVRLWFSGSVARAGYCWLRYVVVDLGLQSRLVVVAGYQPAVYPNKSGFALEVGVLVVPVGVFGVFRVLRNIKDPERPSSLEHLKVLTKDSVEVDDDKSYVRVTFTPTMKLCGMTTLIGLCVRVKLMRNLPGRYKVDIRVAPGSHATEAAVNKQLNDKERVSAALENPYIVEIVDECLSHHLNVA